MKLTRTERILATVLFVAALVGVVAVGIDRQSTSNTQPVAETRNTIEPWWNDMTTTTLSLVEEVTTTTTAPSTTLTPVLSVQSSVQPAPAPVGDCWTDLARTVGWPDDTLGHLEHIIRRESGCDPTAFADRPSTLDNSRGLLQINAYGNLGDHIRRVCGVEPDALFDPATNLACGLVYYQRSGWAPWGG